MGRRLHIPLTDAQRDLAADPEAVRLAEKLAAHHSRNAPYLRDELLSAAMMGLVDAARCYDPGHGTQFTTYAGWRIRGRISDAKRNSRPRGFTRRKVRPRIAHLSDPLSTPDGDTLGDTIPSGEPPVGWEAEWADTVRALAASLPAEQGLCLELYYAHAGHDQPTIGRELGLPAQSVGYRLREALAALREIIER